MSLLSSDSMCGFLLRQIRKVDLCRVWVARCSSSQVIASSKPSKDRRKDVDDVISPQQPQSDFSLNKDEKELALVVNLVTSCFWSMESWGSIPLVCADRCVVWAGLGSSLLWPVPSLTGGTSNVLNIMGRVFGPPYRKLIRPTLTPGERQSGKWCDRCIFLLVT
ncbi:unnamed protein product [Brugia pahangi]|uniref:MFS domain-containing protein n=1 Tax=Brugia pahangi TaxID=6280 RepID=A0A0N4TZB9_BRUPA|nr:unnamed protein product [Brugia pahangi]